MSQRLPYECVFRYGLAELDEMPVRIPQVETDLTVAGDRRVRKCIKHEAALPLPLIADPKRELYRRLGVGQTGGLGPFKPTGGRTRCPTR